MMERYLVLEDGSVYAGEAFGADRSTLGEVVFTTGNDWLPRGNH